MKKVIIENNDLIFPTISLVQSDKAKEILFLLTNPTISNMELFYITLKAFKYEIEDFKHGETQVLVQCKREG